jgi:Uma2 family endonuclease
MAISEQVLNDVIGDVVAINISLEDYMEYYAADNCEYVEGVVIRMSPATIQHNRLLKYLSQLLDAYFELNPIGLLITQPFVMRLAAFPKRRREPDLLVVLKTNPHQLHETFMDGPADVVIEIVSEDSVDRDHGDKFKEYEKGGVPEYWIIDPIHMETRHYRLNEQGRYARQSEDEHGNYRTPTLPGLVLHIPTLWQDALPGPAATSATVKAMLDNQ